jgi:hypothetical protein
MRDHTKLRAFELADEVAVLIYRATKRVGCSRMRLENGGDREGSERLDSVNA